MVTRTDIADAVAHLPDTEFRTLRELWAHLEWVSLA